MNIETATEQLKEFFHEYLVDPLSKRATAWIYDDEGRVELDKSPFPKILLKPEEAGSRKEINAIGSYQTMNTDIIEMHIKCKFGSHYGMGDRKLTGKEFAAHIAEDAENLLKTEARQRDLDDRGFHQVRPIGDRFRYDKEKNPTYILRIEAKYLDGS